MKGKRILATASGDCPWPMDPGDYCLIHAVMPPVWLACTPNGLLASLRRHDVVEHDDGTITVSPSILVSLPHAGRPAEGWHGYLERGEWRTC